MSKTHLEAVLWDLDGVIADTAQYHYLAWRDVFAERGVDYSMADFMPYFGQRHDTIIKATLGDDVTEREIQDISDEKQQDYRRRVAENVRALPGAMALLRSLKAGGIKSAIASSAVPDNIELILGGLGIEDYFQTVVHGMEVKEGKPSPEIFQLAAKRLKVKPGNCVVMEDAIAGVAAARSAGMKCVAVTNSHPGEELKDADLVVDSLEKVGIRELQRLFTNP
jgi:beta-phosphoglucomutase family hydrolase